MKIYIMNVFSSGLPIPQNCPLYQPYPNNLNLERKIRSRFGIWARNIRIIIVIRLDVSWFVTPEYVCRFY